VGQNVGSGRGADIEIYSGKMRSEGAAQSSEIGEIRRELRCYVRERVVSGVMRAVARRRLNPRLIFPAAVVIATNLRMSIRETGFYTVAQRGSSRFSAAAPARRFTAIQARLYTLSAI
jgi:hypothetical protein